MALSLLSALFLLTAAATFRSSVAQPSGMCSLTETCKCKYPNDYTVDLTPLDSFGGPRFVKVPFEDYYYDVNFCSTYTNEFCSDATVCQTNEAQTWRSKVSDMTSALFTNQGDDLYYVMGGGDDGRNAKIRLVCDETTEASLYAYGDADVELTYDFTLYSRYACPFASDNPPPDPDPDPDPGDRVKIKASLSVGSILLIVFFALIILYFVIGTLILKFGMHAEGKEVVPQSGFWTALPGLIKDGIVFIYRKTCGRGGGSGTKYDNL